MTDTEKEKTKWKRPRKVRSDCKYDEKFAKQLRSGIRYKQGLTVMELCRKWRISKKTYYMWVERYESFRVAHELGEVDHAAWWHENFRNIATGKLKGNAGCAIFAMNNVEHIKWSNKVDVQNTGDEEVKKIVIEMLAPRPKAIEHIEGEVITNVIPIGQIVDAE